jgi:DNA-binding beta-propeller fold protein YncE
MHPIRFALVFVVCLVVSLVPRAGSTARPVRTVPTLVFEAPARLEPAGPYSLGDPYGQVLPSGRLLHPIGRSVVVGMNALGVTLTPDGRFAIVSNDDERQAKTVSALDGVTTGGYSLAVVDTQTMTVVSRYKDPAETFFVGIAALRDPADVSKTLVLASGGASNAFYVFDLDPSGTLVPDAHHKIEIPGPTDERFANKGHSFPSTIALGAGGTRAYVIDNLGDDVAQIDIATRTLAGSSVPVGFFPLGAAALPNGLLVANEGLMTYGVLADTQAAPRFANPPPDLEHASSLSILTTTSDGSLVPAPATSLALDRTPDGLRDIGGAHPAAVVAMRTQPYAFVAMSNVDRVAVVSLGAQPHAEGGTELRLYDRGPYGTQPAALALSPNERRLYVALAGIDAIAVLDTTDPRKPHRLGLIPTGWYPSALALSADGRYLYVANTKGFGSDRGFSGDQAGFVDSKGRVESIVADSNAIWSTLERIDLAHVDTRRATALALSYLRNVRRAAADPLVPQRFGTDGSTKIKHVVVLLEENKTYDAMLGDLTDASGAPYGPGRADFTAFDQSVTPNLHALARTYGLAGNFYADAEESDAGHQFGAAGIASVFTERTLLVKRGRRPLVNKNEDPEDYPRAGYVFNSLAERGKTYRDYGDLVRVSGYDEGEALDPKTDDPAFAGVDDASAPTQGLGGRYSLDVPAPAALAGHVDLNYPGWNLRIRDVRRAAEFVRDFDPLVKADAMPAFTYVWLPADHGGAGKNIPPLPEEVADGDRALGRIVEYLTHIPQWSSTAIFIMPDDAQSTRDHVNVHRSYAIVVSPYAKHHFIGMRHVSTVSVLKTEEEILGLPALSLGDALATDLADYFTPVADPAPFVHVEAETQLGSAPGRRIAALLEDTDQSSPDADSDRTAELIGLSRDADRLAAERAHLKPADYEQRQAALLSEAEAVVAR